MRVLVINSAPDTYEMLEAYFQRHGWHTDVALLKDLRDGTVSGASLMSTYRPDAILLDVAIPYEPNWAILQRLRDDPAVTCPVVVTTTNEAAIRRLLGVQERILEVIGKPYDLDLLHDAVLSAVTGSEMPQSVPKTERRVGDRRVQQRSTPAKDVN
jgi:DNA-binding response OmpR family regulator